MEIQEHEVQLPDGSVIQDWLYLAGPNFVLVLCENSDGDFLLLQQRKYAVRTVVHAPIGGIIEPDEAPLHAAQRELLEETGLSARSWKKLGAYVLEPNRHVGKAHLYLARQLRLIHPKPLQPDIEAPNIAWVSPHRLSDIVKREESVASWTLLFLLAINETSGSPKAN
ncbi:NUDIX hydrolase [Neorhodopirellula pilleata]|uniref:ADP-ribose pyrophosphatase n=1 Tax=Neorhodopirellula pilleata TaxID=2714738 RepID=A0A5C5ZP54_9BACT|nr:NUDIX hydrolase [Neorhodopirellula pilleata]TWT89282.1 ADP-ribose pyrophosphatase [Neorhodopirellula pilleata]